MTPAKRPQAYGLVRISRGSGCYVNEIQFMGGSELLLDMLMGGKGRLDPKLVLDSFEFYRQMGKGFIRLAAMRRSEEDVLKLRRVLEKSRNRVELLNEVYPQLTRILSRATKNRVYQLTFNSLIKVFAQIRKQMTFSKLDPLLEYQFIEGLIHEIARQNPEEAELYFERLTNLLKDVIMSFLAAMGGNKKA